MQIFRVTNFSHLFGKRILFYTASTNFGLVYTFEALQLVWLKGKINMVIQVSTSSKRN